MSQDELEIVGPPQTGYRVEPEIYHIITSKLTLHVPGGGHIVPALNFWSSLAQRRSILLNPPASRFGHMGTLCDPDAKKVSKFKLCLSYSSCDEMNKRARNM